MNTKAKGEVSEGHVIAFLLKRSYSVSMPFGDNQRYDLIVDDGVRLWRAQVKTARYYRGCLVFNTASVHGLTGKRVTYSGQIDIFLVYSPYTDKVYRVSADEAGASSMALRIDAKNSENGPATRWASDYELTNLHT